ncbi:hypothetical protein K491DRAFT_695398 [Lophiostoma macrostomum CBS 122681]|uniref:Zn(2)-C6 fungal-type domain-containing protein n=1 Tax=Lophiostoma macrostomum CBS 122681 TaxID=1314788 RepID=A0A6A6T1D5_9PLEO|nr:hypothetical protein K491DRAFT_695398 [Lophiostoma macrostomum CBS 122681]
MNTAEPKSRRKSCAACVAAKRKCGMERPKCKRCQKKTISCAYPDTTSSINDISIPELEFPWLDDFMRNPGLLPWSGDLQPQLATTTDLSAFPIPPLEPNTANIVPGSVPEYLVTSEADGKSQTTLPRAETEAAVHRFKTWPEKWLKEGKAPFIHARLYTTMPKTLQDAYAACAIYSTKTPENEFVAFSIIEAQATSLLNSPNQQSWTPLDLLAAIQSLLIFQFIRLFDGDIRQRALAEAAEPVLELWTARLKSLTTLEREYTVATAPSWRSWVFAESCRRTVLMSIFLLGVYSFVRNGYCDRGKEVSRLSFTANRRLWETESESEWERVTARELDQGRELWIREMDFGGLLKEGRADDMEDFGWIMAVMYRGRDFMERWVVEKEDGGGVVRGARNGAEMQMHMQMGGKGVKGIEELDFGRSLFGLVNDGEEYPEDYFRA